MSPATACREPWTWPDSLDALTAAPNHHRLLLENEQVRVLDVHIPVGDTVPVHTHRWWSVMYVLSSSDFIRRDGEGRVVLDTRISPPPANSSAAIWQPPLPPHSVENVGKASIHLIAVELKDAPVA